MGRGWREYGSLKLKYQPDIGQLNCGDAYLWGHIEQLANLDEISAMSEIAHIRQITKTGYDEVIDIIRENDIIVQTTAVVLQEILNRYGKNTDEYTDFEKSILSKPFLDYIEGKWFENENLNILKTDEDYLFQKQLLSEDFEVIGRLAEEGIILLSCTDSGFYYHGTIPGKSLHQEFEILSQLGLSPYRILRTNTYNAWFVSKRMGLQEEFGIIKTGCRADFLVIDEDPFADIGNLKKRYGVMAAGRFPPRC